MSATQTTYVTTPSTEQIEDAWFDLMQGELGIDHDWRTAELAQALVDHLRNEGSRGVVFTDDTGDPLTTLNGTEVARRVAGALAALLN